MSFARPAAIVMMLALAAGNAVAQNVPGVVGEKLDALAKECDAKPAGARKALQSVDLNGDGTADWLLDTGDLGCEIASFYCGTAGCTLMIFASQPSGFQIAWEGNVLGWQAVTVGKRPGIRFDLHGSACNRSGHEGCVQNYIFQGARLVRAR